MKYGIIILAAGSSSRMGEPKQLLRLPGEKTSLLRRAAETGLDLAVGPVCVVLGSSYESCLKELAGLPLRTVFNPDWSQGMGGSLALGVSTLEKEDLEAVLVMLCDQPGVGAVPLRNLLAQHQHQRAGASITAARYAGTVGPPAVFDSGLFPEMVGLKGSQGAKALLERGSGANTVMMPEAALDLDTQEDVLYWGDSKKPDSNGAS